jgi:hypothetical protein
MQLRPGFTQYFDGIVFAGEFDFGGLLLGHKSVLAVDKRQYKALTAQIKNAP